MSSPLGTKSTWAPVRFSNSSSTLTKFSRSGPVQTAVTCNFWPLSWGSCTVGAVLPPLRCRRCRRPSCRRRCHRRPVPEPAPRPPPLRSWHVQPCGRVVCASPCPLSLRLPCRVRPCGRTRDAVRRRTSVRGASVVRGACPWCVVRRPCSVTSYVRWYVVLCGGTSFVGAWCGARCIVPRDGASLRWRRCAGLVVPRGGGRSRCVSSCHAVVRRRAVPRRAVRWVCDSPTPWPRGPQYRLPCQPAFRDGAVMDGARRLTAGAGRRGRPRTVRPAGVRWPAGPGPSGRCPARAAGAGPAGRPSAATPAVRPSAGGWTSGVSGRSPGPPGTASRNRPPRGAAGRGPRAPARTGRRRRPTGPADRPVRWSRSPPYGPDGRSRLSDGRPSAAPSRATASRARTTEPAAGRPVLPSAGATRASKSSTRTNSRGIGTAVSASVRRRRFAAGAQAECSGRGGVRRCAALPFLITATITESSWFLLSVIAAALGRTPRRDDPRCRQMLGCATRRTACRPVFPPAASAPRTAPGRTPASGPGPRRRDTS